MHFTGLSLYLTKSYNEFLKSYGAALHWCESNYTQLYCGANPIMRDIMTRVSLASRSSSTAIEPP